MKSVHVHRGTKQMAAASLLHILRFGIPTPTLVVAASWHDGKALAKELHELFGQEAKMHTEANHIVLTYGNTNIEFMSLSVAEKVQQNFWRLFVYADRMPHDLLNHFVTHFIKE